MDTSSRLNDVFNPPRIDLATYSATERVHFVLRLIDEIRPSLKYFPMTPLWQEHGEVFHAWTLYPKGEPDWKLCSDLLPYEGRTPATLLIPYVTKTETGDVVPGAEVTHVTNFRQLFLLSNGKLLFMTASVARSYICVQVPGEVVKNINTTTINWDLKQPTAGTLEVILTPNDNEGVGRMKTALTRLKLLTERFLTERRQALIPAEHCNERLAQIADRIL